MKSRPERTGRVAGPGLECTQEGVSILEAEQIGNLAHCQFGMPQIVAGQVPTNVAEQVAEVYAVLAELALQRACAQG